MKPVMNPAMKPDTPTAYADNQAVIAALTELGDAMLLLAILHHQLHGMAGNPGDGSGGSNLDRLAWSASHIQASQQQLQQQIAQQSQELEQRREIIRANMQSTRDAQIFIPWIHLTSLFQLNQLELNILLLCFLVELDSRYSAILRSLTGAAATLEQAAAEPNPSLKSVSLLELELVLGASGQHHQQQTIQQCLGPDAPLRYWDLLVLTPEAALTDMQGVVQLNALIAGYLLARAAPQLHLEQALEVLPVSPSLQHHLVPDDIRLQLSRFIQQSSGPGSRDDAAQSPAGYVLQLQGPDISLGRSLCATAFGLNGMACAVLDGKQIWLSYLSCQKNRAQLQQRLRLLCRNALLCNWILVLQQCHWLSSGPDVDDILDDVMTTLFESQRFVVVLNGPARRIADLAHHYTKHQVAAVLIKTAVPDSQLRRQIWLRHADAAGLTLSDALLDQLVNNYVFTEEQIALVIKETVSRRLLGSETAQLDELLFDSCREQSNRVLMTVAQEVKTPYRFHDIVLPDETRQWMREVLDYAQQRHRVIEEWGFGSKNHNSKNLCILFYGPTGTGKTMAASIIANELNLGLYKIDLANIVSKYIGETEKQLAQLFDQAEAMNIVLFFDEAESLFAKRTETRDAHDRYANLQTGYLLQRIETYPGIVILSTNLLANMDKAFTRRFKFMIEYPFPNSKQRLELWRNAFPAATPLAGDVDFYLLAQRAALSGGNINNIALSAAFLAATEQQPVAQRHVLQATEREFHKLGKVFCAAEFSWGADD